MDEQKIIEYLSVLDLPMSSPISKEQLKEQYLRLEKIYKPEVAPAAFKDGKRYALIKEAYQNISQLLPKVNLYIRQQNGEDVLGKIDEIIAFYKAETEELKQAPRSEVSDSVEKLLRLCRVTEKAVENKLGGLSERKYREEILSAAVDYMQYLAEKRDNAVDSYRIAKGLNEQYKDDADLYHILQTAEVPIKKKLEEKEKAEKERLQKEKEREEEEKQRRQEERRTEAEKKKHPDFKTVRESISSLENLEQTLVDLFDIDAVFEDACSAVSFRRTKLVNDELQRLPIEELNRNKLGVRINALKNAGFNTIYDVIGVSQSRLNSIYGVGTLTASQVCKEARAVRSYVDSTTDIRFSPNNKSDETVEFINTIYKYRYLKSLSVEANALYDQYHAMISKKINAANCCRNGISWLAAGNSKRIVGKQAFKEIKLLVSGVFFRKVCSLAERRDAILTTNNTESWTDFANNTPLYYALLVYLDDYIKDNPQTQNSSANSQLRVSSPKPSKPVPQKRKEKKTKPLPIILGVIVVFWLLKSCGGKSSPNVENTPLPSQTAAATEEVKDSYAIPVKIEAQYHKYADEPNSLIIKNKTDVNCHVELQDKTGMTVLAFDAPVGASEIKIPVGTWKVILQFEGEDAVPCDDEIFSAWDATDPVTLILDYK